MDLELTSVRKAYGDVVALDGVTLAAGANETVAVVGPSGCGKSTLLELVCGLAAPDDGEVRSPPAALMPQRDGLLPWLSALDNAGLARRVAGESRAQARAAAHEHFAAFGLEGFERARPSGQQGAQERDPLAHPAGQRRRARALEAFEPERGEVLVRRRPGRRP